MKEVWIDDEYVVGYDFQHGYISERLTPERVAQWNPETPVFIAAQTGAGKSTMVMQELLPVMKKRNKRIVLLSSRTVLAQQQKRQAAKCECPDMVPELVDALVKYGNRCNWGAVDVFTYQEVALRMEDESFRRNFLFYGAVVCDEVHFFVEDAPFNRLTAKVFEFILSHARRAVRIYLSATPEPVADLIAERELGFKKNRNSFFLQNRALQTHFLFYNFRRNYEYIKPFFFFDWETILEEIKLDTTEDKWLIFVDKKEDGRFLEKALGNSLALYVDAELKNGNLAEEMAKLTETQRFEVKVLIVTKFLDVGVDIWDSDLKKVVVSTCSKTNFLQSLGRKRIKKGEYLTTYIRIPDPDIVCEKLKGIEVQKWKLKEHSKLLGQENLVVTDIPYPFFLEKGSDGKFKMEYNKLIDKAFTTQTNDLLSLLPVGEEKFGEAMARTYLKWLGLEKADIELHWLGLTKSDDQGKIEGFLCGWINKTMDRETYEQFRHEFTCFIKENFPKSVDLREGRDVGSSTIRKFFDQYKIAYKIYNISTGKWRLERG